ERMALKNTNFLILIFLTAFIGASYNSYSQKATIRGTVLDKETGEPIIFTNVILKGTTTGAQTDENGFYSIASVLPGDYTLYSTSIGYDTALVKVSVKGTEIINQKIYL